MQAYTLHTRPIATPYRRVNGGGNLDSLMDPYAGL